MSMFKAGIALALIIIGGLAALLGTAVSIGAIKTGVIELSYGAGADAVAQTVTQAAEPERFWRFVMGFGLTPLVLGAIAAFWGWRTLQRGY